MDNITKAFLMIPEVRAQAETFFKFSVATHQAFHDPKDPERGGEMAEIVLTGLQAKIGAANYPILDRVMINSHLEYSRLRGIYTDKQLTDHLRRQWQRMDIVLTQTDDTDTETQIPDRS